MRAPLGGQHMRGAGAAVRRSAGRLRLGKPGAWSGGGKRRPVGEAAACARCLRRIEHSSWWKEPIEELSKRAVISIAILTVGDVPPTPTTCGNGIVAVEEAALNRYVLASPEERSLVGVMTRAMPWLPTPGEAVMMPNTKDAEKDRTAAFFSPPSGDDDSSKRSGVGWNAWPLTCGLPLVSSSRPSGVTMAVPSRVRSFTPAKPE
uniref:Uncharacterized protein n=1 Tax=Oryza glumipatula TaxID=40148 RepID=A0A0D9YQP5_9ORYZ